MIKNIKTNQDSLSTAHTTLTNAKADGLIITDNRIYYQSKGGANPVFLGGGNQYIETVGTNTTAVMMKGNTTYVRRNNTPTFYLPQNTEYYPLQSGDTIKFFNAHSSTFYIKNSAETITYVSAAAEKALSTSYTFYYTESGWKLFDDYGWAKTAADNISSFISSNIWDTSASTIKRSNLPSATTGGSQGVVKILTSTVPSAYSTSENALKVPAASAIIKVTSTMISGQMSGLVDSSGDVYPSACPSASVGSSYVATVGGQSVLQNNAKWGISQIEGSTSAGIISGSQLPMAASAVWKYVENQDINSKLSGRLSSIVFNGNTYTGPNTNSVDLGDNFIQVTGAQNGQYVIKTANGYTTSPGVATLSSVHTTSDYQMGYVKVKENAIPIMIKTASGSFYPIEKETLIFDSTASQFKIDARPYLAYEHARGNGNGTDMSYILPWTIYYGAGINDVWSNANTVKEVGTTSTGYNALFTSADAYVITISGGSGNFNLTVPVAPTNVSGLPIGHGMIFKIINKTNRSIQFAGNEVATSGQWTFSVFNFTGAAEQCGSVAKVKTIA